LVPRDVEDLTCEELCEVTGLPAGTVKSRLNLAGGVLNGRRARARRGAPAAGPALELMC
jgi:DNA-directed RNA polymerase specialized sigma24 family protein